MEQWNGRDANGFCLSVVMPYKDGYVVSGLLRGGASPAYGGGVPPVKFSTLEAAQSAAQDRVYPRGLNWEAIEVAQ